MAREVKLSRLETELEGLSYPVSRDEAAEELSDVTLLLADGEANLGEVVADTVSREFEDAESLAEEVRSFLPREAVGEPGQSEGEG